MRTASILLLSVLLPLGACSEPPSPPLQQPKPSPNRASYERLRTAACDAYADLDKARMNDAAADFPALAVRAEAARSKQGFDATPPAGAQALVRMTEWGWGGVPAFYLVFRERDGDWRLRWGRFEGRAGEVAEWRTREVALPPAVKGRFAALLAEPCLYAEPAYLPADLPWKTGETGRCFDGNKTLMDISFEGRSRTSYQVCNSGGFTREVRNVVYTATREP